MPSVTVHQEELIGDAEETSFWLETPKEVLPGVTARNALVGEVITTRHLRLLLVYRDAPGSGDFDIPVLELTGISDDRHLILVVPKDGVPQETGADYPATLLGDPAEWTLMITLPPA